MQFGWEPLLLQNVQANIARCNHWDAPAASLPAQCPGTAFVELEALQVACSAAENIDPECIWPWKEVEAFFI